MTEPALNPQQAFLIYSMLFGNDPGSREPKQSEAGLDKAPREALVKAGLIRKEARAGSKAMHLVLTAAAYQWAAEHLGTDLMKTARAAPLLQAVLSRLRDVVSADADTLKAFAIGAGLHGKSRSPGSASTDPRTTNETASLEARIRDAYLSLTRGGARQRVLLKDLRPHVDAPREAVDTALLSMQEQRMLVLMKLDNPTELTAADEAAALHVAGHPRHLLYFQV